MNIADQQMLNILESEFGKVDRMPLNMIEKVRGVLQRAPDSLLRAIVKRSIPFVDTMSVTELVRRKKLPQSAQIDHAASVIAKMMQQGEGHERTDAV